VTPFDPSTLPSTCFGGTKVGHKFDPLSQKMVPNETPKQYSAYLLIYERDHVEFRDESHKKNSRPAAASAEQQAATETWHPPYGEIGSPASYVPNEVCEELVRENTQFLMDKFIFAPEYSAWLLNVAHVVSDASDPPPLDMIRSLTYFVLEVLVRSKEKASLESFMKILCSWYGTSVDACRWLLDTLLLHTEWSVSILLKCPIQALRQGFVSILTVVFSKLAPLEAELYFEELPSNKVEENDAPSDGKLPETEKNETTAEDPKDSTTLWKTSGRVNSTKFECTSEARIKWWKSRSVLGRYVGFLMGLLVNCEAHWKWFDQLFEALGAFARCGYHESIYLIRCGLILRLLDIFLGDAGNIPPSALEGPRTMERPQGRRFLMGDKFSNPNFTPLMALLDLLVRSTIVFNKSDGHANFLFPPGLSPDALAVARAEDRWRILPRRDADHLTANKALQLMMEQGPSVAASVKGIVCHLCFDNMIMSKIVCSTCQKSIEDNKSEEFSLFLDVLLHLVFIIDYYQADRVHLVMSAIIAGIKANIRYEKEANDILRGLRSIIQTERIENNPCKTMLKDWLLVDFPGCLIDELFQIPETILEVKRAIISTKYCIVKNLLLAPSEPGDQSRKRKQSSADDGATPYVEKRIAVSDPYGKNDGPVPSTATAEIMKYLSDDDDGDVTFVGTSQTHVTASPAAQTVCTQNQDLLRDVLTSLVFLFNDINEMVLGFTGNKRQNGGHSDTKAFADYFELLRLCMRGQSNEKDLFLYQCNGIHKNLLHLLWKIDLAGRAGRRAASDVTKGEIILLYKEALTLHPELGEEFISNFTQNAARKERDGAVVSKAAKALDRTDDENKNDTFDHMSKLLELFVTSSKTEEYNEKYIAHYYALMISLSKLHLTFCRRMLNHGNWMWSLRVFIFNAAVNEKGELYRTLSDGAMYFA